MSQEHKPRIRGTACICSDCGLFLFDVRTGARLRELTDVDPRKLAAVRQRFSFDPKLAKRLVDEDPREVVSTYKYADKLNDFLKNPKARPDLQTPEAKHFLDELEQRYHTPRTDPMMPWLAREWKKGRFKFNEQNLTQLQAEYGPEYGYERTPSEPDYRYHALNPAELAHWADWYHSDHPSRQGKDIMQMKMPELHQTVKDWDHEMREQAGGAAQKRGNILHSWPDGWTVQQLEGKHLEDEGEKMGHCVGGYARPVEEGRSLIYSLRDHQNEPHATWEVTPQWWKGEDGKLYRPPVGSLTRAPRMKEPIAPDDFLMEPDPREGTMEQVQGKGNAPPIENYQKRIKEYFEKAIPDPKERPKWEPQHYEDPEYLLDPDDGGYVAYHPGEYGLDKPETTYDWPEMVEGAVGLAGDHSEISASDLTKKAIEHEQFGPFAKEAEDHIKLERENHLHEMQDGYDDWRDQNWEYFASQNPEPQPEDEEYNHPETGEYNKEAYDKAYTEWEKEEEALNDYHFKQYANEMGSTNKLNYMDELEVEIAAQKRRESEMNRRREEQPMKEETGQNPYGAPTTSAVRATHTHFTTGEPCTCTFTKHLEPQWHEAKELVCEACGDPLVGMKCKRCDWGTPSHAIGDGEPLADPTRDMHPSIQSNCARTNEDS